VTNLPAPVRVNTNLNITPASGSTLSNKPYLTTWRWHFCSGLFVVPFMLMLAITGLVILFQPQIEEIQYRDRIFVTPQTQTMPVETQLEAVRKAYPNAKIGAAIKPFWSQHEHQPSNTDQTGHRPDNHSWSADRH
jgi:uncharacterized iron-regulated membrane protein